MIEKVKEFHKLYDLPILEKPTLISKDRAKLRIDLIKEELEELEKAVEDNNIVEVADALTDLEYVVLGAALEFGLTNIFGELFDEVHRSNMSKSCKSLQEASMTVEHYDKRDGTKAFIFESGENYVVRRDDGKLLKSIRYSPANLTKIISK